MKNHEGLIARAADARRFAYAPYSQFAVGAAVETDDGRVFIGCNVENLSFGLTQCAERNAVAAAIAAGARKLQRIAIVSASDEPISPCGACRQVLAEFNPDLLVISATESGKVERFSLGQLLPRPATGILNRQ
jgi:cytidine deaminase